MVWSKLVQRYDVYGYLWSLVWRISEWSGVGIGRFAPFVFCQMMGKPSKRVKEAKNE